MFIKMRALSRLASVAVALPCISQFSLADNNDSTTKRNGNTSGNKWKDDRIGDLVILPGTGSKDLADKIARNLGVDIADINVKRFSDGEVKCKIDTNIRDRDVFVVQTCAAPVNDNIMELLLIISCAKRCGARKVTAVIPYFGYTYHRRGVPISTKNQSRFLWSASADFSKMLSVMGVDRVITVDLHRPGQGHETCFFDSSIPVETLQTSEIMIQYIKNNIALGKNVTIVAANTDFVKKARKYQEGLLNLGVENVGVAALVRKNEGPDNRKSQSVCRLLGSVDNSDVIIVDAVVDTAGSLSSICHLMKKEGANKIYYCASHGLFTENSMNIIALSPVENVIVTDSLPFPKNGSDKIIQVSVARELSKIIETEYFSNIIYRKEDEEDYAVN
jgi:ribose-phosphate pyrophosphokinase